MNSFFRYYGSKAVLIPDILRLLPPHKKRAEVFGGRADLTFATPPCPLGDVYNDVDSGLHNLFCVIRDPEKFSRFHDLAWLTPYSYETFRECRDTWEEQADEVDRAYRFWVMARMAYGGMLDKAGWSRCRNEITRGVTPYVKAMLASVKDLPDIHARALTLQVENLHFRDFLRDYDSPNMLFYLDPPYVPDTRKAKGYRHEMTLEDHEELVSLLPRLKGMAVLSGYDHPVYAPLNEAGWDRHDIESVSHTNKAKGKRVETIWRNPACFTNEGIFGALEGGFS